MKHLQTCRVHSLKNDHPARQGCQGRGSTRTQQFLVRPAPPTLEGSVLASRAGREFFSENSSRDFVPLLLGFQSHRSRTLAHFKLMDTIRQERRAASLLSISSQTAPRHTKIVLFSHDRNRRRNRFRSTHCCVELPPPHSKTWVHTTSSGHYSQQDRGQESSPSIPPAGL